MDKETRVQYFMKMMELRKKELLQGLQGAEDLELRRLCNELAREEEYYKYQLEVEIIARTIKNVNYEEHFYKRNLLDRLMKKEKTPYYSMSFDDGGDLYMYGWTFEFALEMRRFMENHGLKNVWAKMLPVTMEMSPLEYLKKDEVEWLENLPDPKWCAQQCSQVDGLLDKAKQHSEDMHEFVEFLVEQWEDGYQIYLDCTEISYM